jgi:hypothetical protein
MPHHWLEIVEMKKRSVIGSILIAATVAGCASNSREISAAYVSPLAYNGYTCPQLAAEMQRISTRVQQVSGTVDDRASNDSVAMGVGMILFWPALFFMKGDGPEAQELARLKGEYEAVNQAAIRNNCGMNVAPPPPPVANQTGGKKKNGGQAAQGNGAGTQDPSGGYQPMTPVP